MPAGRGSDLGSGFFSVRFFIIAPDRGASKFGREAVNARV
jgi:hypothetical protein